MEACGALNLLMQRVPRHELALVRMPVDDESTTGLDAAAPGLLLGTLESCVGDSDVLTPGMACLSQVLYAVGGYSLAECGARDRTLTLVTGVLERHGERCVLNRVTAAKYRGEDV